MCANLRSFMCQSLCNSNIIVGFDDIKPDVTKAFKKKEKRGKERKKESLTKFKTGISNQNAALCKVRFVCRVNISGIAARCRRIVFEAVRRDY